jgi:hypothetical protein
MKWSRDHVLTWGYKRNLIVTVDLDRIKVISSGNVNAIMQKSVFQNSYLVAILELKSDQVKI